MFTLRGGRILESFHISPISVFAPLFLSVGRYWPKGQTPHLGRVHRGCCSDEVHMEEEGVQVQVQAEEEIGEKHGREQGDRRENKQSLKRMTHECGEAHQHLGQCGITHHYACAL